MKADLNHLHAGGDVYYRDLLAENEALRAELDALNDRSLDSALKWARIWKIAARNNRWRRQGAESVLGRRIAELMAELASIKSKPVWVNPACSPDPDVERYYKELED